MPNFPENDVQVFRDYNSAPIIAEKGPAMVNALAKARNRDVFGSFGSNAEQIAEARRVLTSFLVNPALQIVDESQALAPIGGEGVYELIKKRDYSQALQQLDSVIGTMHAPLDRASVDLALTREPVGFRFEGVIGKPPEGADPEIVIKRGSLPGYAGPDLSSKQRRRLAEYSHLFVEGVERRFWLDSLRAECHLGLRTGSHLKSALRLYEGLLAEAGLDKVRRKFVAIRASVTILRLADGLFRSERRLPAEERRRARITYRDAVAVLEANGVSAENPLATEIIARSTGQRSKLEAGLNFLGCRDSFVPVLRHEFLLARTNDHVQTARDAVQKFETYQQKADNLKEAERQTEFELDVAREGVDNALGRQSIAAAQVARTGVQLEQIESQQGLFSMQSLSETFTWAGKMLSSATMAAAGSPGGSDTSMVLGTAAMVTGHMARQQELGFQHRLAEVDRDIANLEAKIAASEVEIARTRVTFLEEKLRFGPGRFDTDLYYALAHFYEQLAERQVEAAIRYAYLYERAIAFFLGKPGLSHVRLDYRSGGGSLSFGLNADGRLITAADRLNEDVLRVTDELAAIPPEDVRRPFTEPPLSLSREYPIEWSRFVRTAPGQKAQMDFGISFLQLAKRRPDCHQVRILSVTVKIPAISEGANFAGTLTHWGRFLIRDRASTTDPPAVRLIPTPEEVEEALRDQQETGTAQAAISGVLPYALPPQAVPFGQPTNVTNEFQEFTLGAFEGYGPAGQWQLELRNINVRDLSDITLTFDLEAAADPNDLEATVVPLIASYEQELANGFTDGQTPDRLTIISLDTRFRREFEELASGVATFPLSADLFDDLDFDGEDARVRTVIAQALDTDGAGVAGVQLEISKVGTPLVIARTTGADGLSEDFSQGMPPIQPPGSRPPGAGAWQVRLPDPSQFVALDGLVLFFLCDQRPAG